MIDNDKRWCVYVHTVPKEISNYNYDKYYIGITCQPPKKRWVNGNGYKKGYASGGTAFYNAIQKYGWENIRHDVILTGLTKEEAERAEIEKIQEYNSYVRNGHGYNETLGGNLTIGYRHSQKTKDTISKKAKHRQQNYDINPISIPIYKFTDLGIFIKKYNSYSDALKDCGALPDCLNNKQLISNGCIWRREEDVQIKNDGTVIPINLIKKVNKNASVYMFDKNCVFIKRFNSKQDAAKYLKISEIDNKTYKINTLHYSMGYIFRNSLDVELINNVPHMKDEQEIKKIIRNRKIYQFSIQTKELINIYENYDEIEEKTGFSRNAIRCNVCKENKTSKGYIWRSGKDVGFTENGEVYFIA